MAVFVSAFGLLVGLLVTADFPVVAQAHICAFNFGNHHAVAIDDIGRALVLGAVNI